MKTVYDIMLELSKTRRDFLAGGPEAKLVVARIQGSSGSLFDVDKVYIKTDGQLHYQLNRGEGFPRLYFGLLTNALYEVESHLDIIQRQGRKVLWSIFQKDCVAKKQRPGKRERAEARLWRMVDTYLEKRLKS